MADPKKKRSNKRQSNTMQWIMGGLVSGAVLIIAALALGVFQDDEPSQQSFDPNFEPEVTGAPRVEVDQDVVNYGDVKLGATVNTVFKVRNVGDKPLEIIGEPRVELLDGC